MHEPDPELPAHVRAYLQGIHDAAEAQDLDPTFNDDGRGLTYLCPGCREHRCETVISLGIVVQSNPQRHNATGPAI